GEAGVVHDVEGVDPVLLEDIPHGGDAPGGICRRVEAPVPVKEYMVILVASGYVVDRLLNIECGTPVAASRGELTIVDMYEVTCDLLPSRAGLKRKISMGGPFGCVQ